MDADGEHPGLRRVETREAGNILVEHGNLLIKNKWIVGFVLFCFFISLTYCNIAINSFVFILFPSSFNQGLILT